MTAFSMILSLTVSSIVFTSDCNRFVGDHQSRRLLIISGRRVKGTTCLVFSQASV